MENLKSFKEFLNEAANNFKLTITSKSGAVKPFEMNFSDLSKALKYMQRELDAVGGGSINMVLMKETETGGWVEVDWKSKLKTR